MHTSIHPPRVHMSIHQIFRNVAAVIFDDVCSVGRAQAFSQEELEAHAVVAVRVLATAFAWLALTLFLFIALVTSTLLLRLVSPTYKWSIHNIEKDINT